jgi:DNA-binding CsgD family transcriptional regulator
VSSSGRSAARSGRSVLLPYALAGNRREAAVAVICIVGLGFVLAVEILTPDVVVGSVAVLPLIAAAWLLSSRPAAIVGAAAIALFGVAIAFESANQMTVVVVGLVTLATGLLARLCAGRVAKLIEAAGRSSRVRPRVATSDGVRQFGEGAQFLTARELDVARLAAQGYTAAEIGRDLHIGDRTVESHLASTYSKLSIRSKGELIRRASRPESGHADPR